MFMKLLVRTTRLYSAWSLRIQLHPRCYQTYTHTLITMPEPVMPPQPSQQFRGRLGYACLNTVLRAQQPPIFQSRTCRMATIVQNGVSHAHALGVQNAKDIIPMLHWNEAHNIRFLRLSSEMFPFASHEVHGYNIADVPGAKEVLKEVGEVARRLGHRLTMHPGQFTQLASPRPEVVRNAIRDLEYHCQILDLLGADQDSVLIIHMGGVYGDKPATIARFHENWATVPPHIQKRVVLENDEICYSVEDLLPTCEKFQIPLVLDWHHDSILPSSLPTLDYIPRINAIWHARGIKVKQHYSEGRPGAVTPMQRRAHSDRVVQMPPCEPDVDLMIEAKDKEMAVLGLMRVLGWQVDEGLPVDAERQKELAKLAKRATKKVLPNAVEDDESDAEGETGNKPAKKKRAKKAVANVEDDGDVLLRDTVNKSKKRSKKTVAVGEDEEAMVDEQIKPRKSGRRKMTVSYEEQVESIELEVDEIAPSRKKKRSKGIEKEVEDGISLEDMVDIGTLTRPTKRKKAKSMNDSKAAKSSVGEHVIIKAVLVETELAHSKPAAEDGLGLRRSSRLVK